jgi:multiple sugar transport system substrate-binding protein
MRVRAILLAAALVLAPFSAWGADLVVWWEEEFAPGENNAVREMMADFEKRTGRTVELTFFDQDTLPERLQAALAAGAPPDFEYGTTTNRWIPEWAREDRLVEPRPRGDTRDARHRSGSGS